MKVNAADGMNYAPVGKPQPVVKPGEFIFSAAHLDHGHIYGMTNALLEAGGTLKYVYDPDPEKVARFIRTYPQAIAARSEEEALADKETHMICGAHITSERGALGLRVMDAGKDYFTDKAPFTTTAQLNAAKEKVAQTGRKYMVYYGERLHCEGAILAGYMIDQGLIGQVIHVEGFGPHRLMKHARPDWFFVMEKYGGVLCDIGSHQIEQYLHFAGEESRSAASATTPIPTIRIWMTSATAASPAPRVRPTTSAWTGSPPTGCAPGATDAPSSWAPRAILRSASTSTSAPTWTAAIMCTWSTATAKSTSTPRAQPASPSSAS